MRGWRTPLVRTGGFVLLLAVTACTGGAPAEPAPASPHPVPTVFTGAVPPGLGAEPVRVLHGAGGEGPDILDDPMGVRIQSVGDAFLISSNSEERHLLQRASDGAALWESDQRVEGFPSDRGGADVLAVTARDGDRTTVAVVAADGETVWSGSDPRDVYVDGWVVHRPSGWSADDPYGEFVVRGTGGGTAWSFVFEEPPDEEDAPEAADDGAEADPGRMGAPVGARGDVLLLDDGAGLLQARDLGADGDLLWSASADDPDISGGRALPQPRPHLVGFYDLSETGPGPADGTGSGGPHPTRAPEDAETGGEPEGGRPNAGASAPGEGAGPAGGRATALVRWGVPEAPSRLSLHDLRTGDVLWSLREPGANPVDRAFDTERLPGTVYDRTTGTLLVPQRSGETPMIAVDLAAGEIRWQFDGGAERAISPTFALAGYVYGDSRGAEDGDVQVVLEAATKEVVPGASTGYVEAVTDDGYALVVQDRQRFVFPPAGDRPDAGRSATPSGTATPR
ncbi:hypothetical protein [Marinitenerispora sediminis]|uniref:Pyrrolo-quinoline quinone n=1 Tax=Marinitenerispora sediminis TaxID=1931232 RepID=A0A368T4Q9_9ACTN|nr:hypothetical protein [Marinitenerispora sediminis]RCV57279.1 hypothetical protein DEF28_01990 [Marinitenerispora sediminis]RCV58260.1 hypothetical protein DEF23_09225 [Marinitenerispora sediminis]RCV58481.1 hypothetical protein DEF24_13265 [Marinitenerispora sediminis]